MTTVITTIGLDLAKLVFQVHGADSAGNPLLRKRLRRGQMLSFFANLPPCLIGMEACGSAHYWARELQALAEEETVAARSSIEGVLKEIEELMQK